jgi:hypothetical protein
MRSMTGHRPSVLGRLGFGEPRLTSETLFHGRTTRPEALMALEQCRLCRFGKSSDLR